MNQPLSQITRTKRVMNAVAAGTSNQTSSAVDMAAGGGFRGVKFTALFGALTAGQVTYIKAQQSSDDGSTDAYDDIAGSKVGALADADGNKVLILDVPRPTKRYVKLVVVRGTQNAVIDGVIAELYGANAEPVSQDSSVSASGILISPAEGTP